MNNNFKEIAENFRTEHFSTLEANSLKGYNAALASAILYFGDYNIVEITPKIVNNYIIYVTYNSRPNKALAFKTVKNRFLILNLLFKYACREGYISNNPCEFVTIPKGLARTKRYFPNINEIKIVKNSIDCTFGLFFITALYTGLRRGELLALEWEDIDFDNNIISVTKSVYHKGNTAYIKPPKTESGIRNVILLNCLKNILLPLKDKGYIFNHVGKLLTNKEITYLTKAWHEESDCNLSAHSLRHYFCTMCYEAGLDVKVTQYIMGHSNISTTLEIYTRIRQNKLMEKANLLNSISF